MKSNRILREEKTVELMIQIYCKKNHKTESLCPSCIRLLNYSKQRAANCPYHPYKPACSDCKTHCYKKDMRLEIKNVMRFAGPRILFIHPFHTLMHYLDKLVYSLFYERKARNLKPKNIKLLK